MDAISKLLGNDFGAATSAPKTPGRRAPGRATSSGYGRPRPAPRTPKGGAAGAKKSASSNGMGKEDSNRVGTPGHPEVINMDSLKVSHSPGRKGGTFQLPLGARLMVPDGLFNKKDSISCRVAAPHTRWATCPMQLPGYEHVSSELYTLKSSMSNLKKTVIVQIPFQPIGSEYGEVNVKGKWTDGSEWVNVGFLIKECDNKPCVELELTKLGTFLVTTRPRTELFDVTVHGCLYQARLSRHITARFPKRGLDQNVQCALQIHPIPPEKLQLARDLYPIEIADVTRVTEFVDIIPNTRCNFRRAATIKLPLPEGLELDVEGGGDVATSRGHPDIAVLIKSNATGWELVESLYKFTRTTVTFDVKELSRYCVVQCVAGRQKKMREATSLIEDRNNRMKGEICLFLSMKERSWRALIEVIPKKQAETKISDRKAQGFTVVQRQLAPVIDPTPVRFNLRRPPPPSRGPKKGGEKEDSFEIYEGLSWLVDIDGDIKSTVQSDLRENNQLRFFSRLSESFRMFDIEPINTEPKALEAAINLVPVGISDMTLRNKTTFTFKVEIEESTVIEYLAPETVPEEKVPEKPKELDLSTLPPEPVKKEAPPPTVVTPRIREIPTNVMKRLTTNIRPVRVPERESRALSGKSLMTLARLIPEGLTLAVHLQLPDSTITGIGFDALSNNLNMSDVSYKILLHWKRKLKDKQNGAIQQLTEALQEMNYQSIAEAILDCHQRKKEFTPDCISHGDLYARVSTR